MKTAHALPRRVVEDRVIDRWMGVEMTGLARSLVAAARPVGDLLASEEPTAPTRGGDAHRFDAAALRRLADGLSPLERRRVRVPVTFWVDKDMSDDAYVNEPDGPALRAAGAIPPDREPREGKYWISHALARETAARWPTLFQFAYF